MGFRYRKSIKIAPGVRMNVGSKSMGVSVGTRGIRYSVNSKTGARTTVGIPGTGVSYTTHHGKGKTKAYSRNSELKRLQKEQAKMAELQRNKLEVELFENRIEMIHSIHKECDQYIDWNEVSNRIAPFDYEGGFQGRQEIEERRKLQEYKPSIVDKIFKRVERKTMELNANIERAIEVDKQEYMDWKRVIKIANEIKEGNIDTYLKVVEEMRPLDDLLEFGGGFEFFIEEPSSMEVDFEVNTEIVVPTEVKSLTKTGKVSTKKMTKTMYYDIQQDYVCSCTLRIARDMFSLLPIEKIVINAMDNRLDSSTGNYNKEVILSVEIDRKTLDLLNMDLIDPSDSMANFKCNMNFKKTSGFLEVEKLLN